MGSDDVLVPDAQAPDLLHSKLDEPTGMSPTARKRKASSSESNAEDPTSHSPKRMRRGSEITHNGTARSPPAPISSLDRRQSASVEEKKRGKRLFGGLLSTLSRTDNSSSQKRRSEVERRQQARASQQKAEDDKQNEARLAKLKAVRRREQVRWEEQVMRTKHDHLLDAARFLQTRCEPRIYYLPWKLTQDQEDDIKDQIHDVEDLIEKETREFEQRKEQRLTALGAPSKPVADLEPAPEPHVPQAQDSSKDPSCKVDTDALPDEPPQSHSSADDDTHGHEHECTIKVGHHHDRDADETGDVMVEGDEDTVIY